MAAVQFAANARRLPAGGGRPSTVPAPLLDARQLQAGIRGLVRGSRHRSSLGRGLAQRPWPPGRSLHPCLVDLVEVCADARRRGGVSAGGGAGEPPRLPLRAGATTSGSRGAEATAALGPAHRRGRRFVVRESFLRVHWVAVPEALRARRVNRRRRWRCRRRCALRSGGRRTRRG
jgi:hypothetical protein